MDREHITNLPFRSGTLNLSVRSGGRDWHFIIAKVQPKPLEIKSAQIYFFEDWVRGPGIRFKISLQVHDTTTASCSINSFPGPYKAIHAYLRSARATEKALEHVDEMTNSGKKSKSINLDSQKGNDCDERRAKLRRRCCLRESGVTKLPRVRQDNCE
jgi:hypothetical protein